MRNGIGHKKKSNGTVYKIMSYFNSRIGRFDGYTVVDERNRFVMIGSNTWWKTLKEARKAIDEARD